MQGVALLRQNLGDIFNNISEESIQRWTSTYSSQKILCILLSAVSSPPD